MRVAIIFCTEPEHERGQNENRKPFFRRSEKESLPETGHSTTPKYFQLTKVFRVNSRTVQPVAGERATIDNCP